MASKEYYLEKIALYGLKEKSDALKDLSEEELGKLHWTKLKDIVELYESQVTPEPPVTNIEIKASDTPETLKMIQQLQEDFRRQQEAFQEEIRRIKDDSRQNIVVQTTDKEEVWGRKKIASLKSGDFEDPSTFLVVGKGFCTSTYYKDGMEMLAPYGSPIFFKLTSSNKRGSAHSEQLLHISTYRTHSKLEKEWLRNHPLYGNSIHERIKDILTHDPKISSKIEYVASSINSMNSHQILAKANSYGLDMGMNLDLLKSKIITIEAQRMLEDDIKRQELHVVRKLEEKLTPQEA